eukprot:NODE_1822_length_1290_cov_4.352135_g1508_i0.p10 GENE.NODE_1822_length_1290_cov_4.352135_g1508_i0~~NODE_1822_length_1290_cov_4.352135_g1508_i0.p10  ORF type:complete len:52 (+),score=0.83 NODE_1822_length_1290_cov_4.352135_g1508_i0:1133-1288(+)
MLVPSDQIGRPRAAWGGVDYLRALGGSEVCESLHHAYLTGCCSPSSPRALG